MTVRACRTTVLAASLTVFAVVTHAEEDLQKQLSNPVADLITLPIQYTGTMNTGPYDQWQHTFNIQPVYPMKLQGGWSLINRAIVPVLSSPAFAPGQDRENGLGDITYQGFFAPPPGPGGLIWGVGPAFMLDTASDDRLGTGKYSFGPTAVALKEDGKWSYGGLVTQLWSFAGDSNRRNVNLTQVQPILSYRIDPKYSLSYLGIIQSNWDESRSDQRWTVPLGVGLSILTKPQGFVPINYIVGGGVNVIRPDTTGDWFIRLQVNFILPK